MANTISDKLKSFRRKNKITQWQLADMCTDERGSYVAVSQISRWENGGPISSTNRAMLGRVMSGKRETNQ